MAPGRYTYNLYTHIGPLVRWSRNTQFEPCDFSGIICLSLDVEVERARDSVKLNASPQVATRQNFDLHMETRQHVHCPSDLLQSKVNFRI
jgi:hypothetical protein